MAVLPTEERSAGAVVVRLRDGTREALLIRCRRVGYEFPKGHIEAGETAERAALRELAEETALESEVDIARQLGEIAYALRGGGSKRVVFFLCTTNGDPIFGPRPKGTRELRWVASADIAGLPLVAESLRPILERALQ